MEPWSCEASKRPFLGPSFALPHWCSDLLLSGPTTAAAAKISKSTAIFRFREEKDEDEDYTSVLHLSHILDPVVGLPRCVLLPKLRRESRRRQDDVW